MRRALAVGLAALALATSGCASQQISLAAGSRSFTRADYERVYEAWTRDADEFAWGRLRTVLHATATFESWEFRWAYVIRYADDHALLTDERSEMLRATLADAQENHRFFVTVAGESFRHSNLASRASGWRVLLVDEDGRQTSPVEIERIRRPTAAEEVYFPTVSGQRHAFRITFPVRRADGTPSIPPDAEFVVLRFAGALGTVDLRWDFVEPGEEETPVDVSATAVVESD